MNLKSRLDKSLDQEGLVDASRVTSSNNNCFKDSVLLFPMEEMYKVTFPTSQVKGLEISY